MQTSDLPVAVQSRTKGCVIDSVIFSPDKIGKIATKIKDVITYGTLPLTGTSTVDEFHTYFAHIADEDVIRAIRNMPCKTSSMDYVPNMVLRSAANVFGHLIANLANLSFAYGVFPSSFKVSQVTPLLKKPGASMENMSNYRPITYLKVIGKIPERLAMEQMRRQ